MHRGRSHLPQMVGILFLNVRHSRFTMQMSISTCHPHPARSGLTNGVCVTKVQRCASDALRRLLFLSHAAEQRAAKYITTTYVNLTVNGDVCFALCFVHHPPSIGACHGVTFFTAGVSVRDFQQRLHLQSWSETCLKHHWRFARHVATDQNHVPRVHVPMLSDQEGLDRILDPESGER